MACTQITPLGLTISLLRKVASGGPVLLHPHPGEESELVQVGSSSSSPIPARLLLSSVLSRLIDFLSPLSSVLSPLRSSAPLSSFFFSPPRSFLSAATPPASIAQLHCPEHANNEHANNEHADNEHADNDERDGSETQLLVYEYDHFCPWMVTPPPPPPPTPARALPRGRLLPSGCPPPRNPLGARGYGRAE